MKEQVTESKKVSIWSRNFICIMIANCLLQMSHSATNSLISTYATFLGAAPKLMGLLTGMFFGVALAVKPAAGPIQTRSDHKKLIIVVFSIGVIVNAGYALFHTIPLFVAFRVLHGVQYAFVGSLCMTIAANSLPQERMASGLGMFGVSSAISQSIAPQIGLSIRDWWTGLAGEDAGFTAIFVFAGICMFLAIIPSLAMIPNPKTKEEIASTGKWYQNIISKNAIIPACVMLFLIMSHSIFSSYMVPFGAELGLEGIGLFFTVLAGVMLVSRPVSGRLTDKLGLRKLFIPGALLFAASFLIVCSAKSLPQVLVGAFIAALGYGSANPCIQTMTMQTESKARRAVASNTLYLGMDVGLFLGPIVGGFIRDYSSYKSVIFAGFIPPVIALVIFLVFWPKCSKRIQAVKQADQA